MSLSLTWNAQLKDLRALPTRFLQRNLGKQDCGDAGCDGAQCPSDSKYRSASMAAMQPVPAAVTACL